ncbi:hybrid sensor histidine kinase/response regulator [Sulfurimonas sp.]|uniref:hybrid sensor histidine kinase/response regulator n=1 Tax=Sulfurimonas sp. TaxID=2022749 RepID=UPI002B49D7BC|nr:hybrid sensor histidine kinase/response regulator [Sulfurimonas sp.]
MRNKQSILIVDDAKENINILVEVLKRYDLITALNGETALRIIHEEEIDLILLDIMMPDMDGFEVCSIIKKNKKTAHIPIIFLSALNKDEDIQKGFELGAVDYVTKPFKTNELLSRAHTHLRLRSYEKKLEKKVTQEIAKNSIKQQIIHQQFKQAALGELLMHITHQWKQPLSALSSINLLQMSKIEQDIEITKKELLNNTKQSADLISFMSETVDTFKKFYDPNFKEDFFSLTNSVNNVIAISDATFDYENITITLHSHENENTLANENEFTQVILSILNNTKNIFKLRGIKDPCINIEVENKKLTISDNAGGIDVKIINDIFLPFVSTTNSNGIGLYIAKEIINKNGGVISAKNSDIGSIFTVEFLTWLD